MTFKGVDQFGKLLDRLLVRVSMRVSSRVTSPTRRSLSHHRDRGSLFDEPSPIPRAVPVISATFPPSLFMQPLQGYAALALQF